MNHFQGIRRRIGALIIALLVTAGFWASRAGALHLPETGQASYLKRASSAVAVTPDGARLLVVNPDSSSLSIVDLGLPTSVIEIPVGWGPRTVAVTDDGTRAFVASHGASTISVIDLSTDQAVAVFPTAARPYGVVVSPGGTRIYVAEQGADQLSVYDTATFSKIRTYPTLDRPSGVAISPDGETVLVTYLHTNMLGILRPYDQPVFLPLVLNHDAGPVTTDLQTARIPETPFTPGFTYLPLWSNSNLLQSAVLGPDGLLAYLPHTRSNSANQALTVDSTVFPTVSLVDITGPTHLVGQHLELATLDPPAVGLPFDAALNAAGTELWVANAASNDITVIDLISGSLTAHIEVSDNPRGITLSPDGLTAYVNNALAGTVSIVDTAAYTVTQIITTTTIPLDPILLEGKKLFHSSDDPRMSLDQWMSCNTCHFDGGHDGQTWFLGFAGPRNTTNLQGLAATLPLRWSGEWDEAADSEFAIRMDSFGTGLYPGEMNCSLDPADCVNHPPHTGGSVDLDALAAYINTYQEPLSPDHLHGEPLSPAAERGKIVFEDPALACVTCHPPPAYTDGGLHDVGTATIDERIGPAYNPPSLLGVYDSPPYFHDGRAATLLEALASPNSGPQHDLSDLLSVTDIQDLVAYINALPYE